jgi:sigma-B regulation protein RsbU (phosphoserine phosphatase)
VPQDPELQEARAEIERLRVLVEASKLINSSLEPRALWESILSVTSERLGVERGTLYFVDEKKAEIWAELLPEHGLHEIRLPIGQGLAGWVAKTGEEVILEDAASDARFDPSLDRRSGFTTRSMICVPVKNRHKAIVGVLQLLNKKEGTAFRRGDLEFLTSVSDHLAIAMENTTLHRALLVKERMERELKLGREIQARLLPPVPTGIPRTTFAAAFRPCYEVGGDYYDFSYLPTGEIGLAVGDVSGKGAPAALIMSSVKAALRVAAPLVSGNIVALTSRLNELLLELAQGRKHVTLFFASYAPATGRLRYVNAGHQPPLVMRAGGYDLLSTTGMPIGLLPEAHWREAEVCLEPGSSLLLYTDGVTEAVDPSEEQFGHDRLHDAARAALGRDFSGAPDAVLDAIDAFQEGAPPTDDETLVVVQRG